MAVEFLRKISVSTVFGKVPAKLDKQIDLGVYVGTVHSCERKSGDLGVYVRFTGSFGARHNGKEYRAAVMYLPAYLADMLESTFTAMGEGSTLEFGLRLYARPDAKSGTGYVYSHETLLEEAGGGLDRLFEAAQASAKSLPPGDSEASKAKASKGEPEKAKAKK
jgi:hypothetical protein